MLAEDRPRLISDDTRFEDVKVLDVDEHVWPHTRRGDKYVTVIIVLTGVREGTGTALLLDMVEGRSRAVFKTWLAARPAPWRAGIEVVAMDGFTGLKTAAVEEIPKVVAVMDPFYVARLATDTLPISTASARPTVPPRPSPAASNTYEASPLASVTSPVTSSVVSSKRKGSKDTYTLDWEEPTRLVRT